MAVSLSYSVIGCAMEVYKTLGPRLLESVYEKVLLLGLRAEGFNVKSQVPIEAFYKGKSLGEGF